MQGREDGNKEGKETPHRSEHFTHVICGGLPDRSDACVRATQTNEIRNSSCASYLSRLAVCDYAVTASRQVSGSIISYKVNIVFQIYD